MICLHAASNIFGGVAKFINVHEENDFELSCDDLEKSITPRSKLLILTSPCNPTGAVLGRETLKGIAAIAQKHDLFIISDEVYRDLRYDGEPYYSIAAEPNMKERCLVVDSFSKAYAMPGFRLGFAIGCGELISSMISIYEGFGSCVFAPLQYAAIEALENSQDAVAEMLDIYRKRREIICEGLNSIEGISCRYPKGAFYVMPNIKSFNIPSREFADRLVEEAGVVTVPGSGLGENSEGYLRLCFAANEDKIKLGIERIDSFVRSL